LHHQDDFGCKLVMGWARQRSGNMRNTIMRYERAAVARAFSGLARELPI
jgi:hypothetical protein